MIILDALFTLVFGTIAVLVILWLAGKVWRTWGRRG